MATVGMQVAIEEAGDATIEQAEELQNEVINPYFKAVQKINSELGGNRSQSQNQQQQKRPRSTYKPRRGIAPDPKPEDYEHIRRKKPFAPLIGE